MARAIQWVGSWFLVGVVLSWLLGHPLSPVAVALGAALIASGSLIATFRAMERSAPLPPTRPPRKTIDSIKDGPLFRLRMEWLADPRPAWETVDAFERDVERLLSGRHREPPRGLPPRSERAHGLFSSCPSCGGGAVSSRTVTGMEGQTHRCSRGHFWRVFPESVPWHDPAPF